VRAHHVGLLLLTNREQFVVLKQKTARLRRIDRDVALVVDLDLVNRTLRSLRGNILISLLHRWQWGLETEMHLYLRLPPRACISFHPLCLLEGVAKRLEPMRLRCVSPPFLLRFDSLERNPRTERFVAAQWQILERFDTFEAFDASQGNLFDEPLIQRGTFGRL